MITKSEIGNYTSIVSCVAILFEGFISTILQQFACFKNNLEKPLNELSFTIRIEPAIIIVMIVPAAAN